MAFETSATGWLTTAQSLILLSQVKASDVNLLYDTVRYTYTEHE